jgi:hypothetical protein
LVIVKQIAFGPRAHSPYSADMHTHGPRPALRTAMRAATAGVHTMFRSRVPGGAALLDIINANL